MLETKDSKRFFTNVKNKEHLKEYCKTFGAKMMLVKAELKRKQVMDLTKLVPALCDKNHKNSKVKFEKIGMVKFK
jgi:hypothetical protein